MNMKKIFAGVMAFCVVAGAVPFVQTDFSDNTIVANAEDKVYSGICGENATWAFDEATATLTISGTGDMYSYYSAAFFGYYLIPWYHHNIETINIENGITEIGTYAFVGLDTLKSVTIPESITTIGGETFSGCTNLTSIIIPESVTTINYLAFSGCTNLTSVTIPNSVKYIDSDAFAGTSWLEKKREENPLVIVNDILVDGRTCEGEIIIPEDVKVLSRAAFSRCENITSVSIPESVESIGDYAFCECRNLELVTLPKNISIGEQAFSYCQNLKSITIPNGASIKYRAFSSCTALTEVKISDDVNIERAIFDGCSKLTTATISSNNTGDGAFKDCRNLKEVTLVNGVIKIDDDSFSSYDSLTEITIPESVIVILF